MKRLITGVGAAVLVGLMAGCASDGDKSKAVTVAATNAVCPYSGKPVNASVEPVAYKDQKVGFCCNGCKGKFTAASDADQAAALKNLATAK
jgi:hypothetical protein